MNDNIIYKITNLVNGKIYVGQTSKDLDVRWKYHKAKHSNPKVNILLYLSMRKYGISNFKIEEIERVNINNVCDKEIFYIEFYSSFYKTGKGYNMTLGGRKAANISMHPNLDKIKKKMSKSKLGIKNNRFGKPHSEESKILMSKNHADYSGDKHPQAINYKITSPENKIYIIYGEFLKFCKTHNLSHHVLRSNVNKGIINSITHKRSLRHYGWSIEKLKPKIEIQF